MSKHDSVDESARANEHSPEGSSTPSAKMPSDEFRRKLERRLNEDPEFLKELEEAQHHVRRVRP